MKKILLLSIIVVFFYSCQTIKGIIQTPSAIKQIDFALKGVRMIKKTEETYYYGKKSPFVFKDNAIFIPCKINDTANLIYYDIEMSGMSIKHGLLREEISSSVEFPKCIKTIKVKEKSNSNHYIVYKSGLKYYDVVSDFFDLKKLVGVVTSVSNDTFIPNRFVIGQDVFPNSQDAMLLNFSDTTITLLDSINIYDTTDFTFVKSLYTCRGLEICLTIDSIEYSFLFNTASKEFLSMPQYAEHQKCAFVNGKFKCDNFYVQYEKHKKENDVFITSYKEQNVIDTLITQQTNAITIGNLDSISGEIHYIKNSTRPVIGMQFISQFDWIIDMYKQKIYVKKIKEKEF